MIKLPHPDAYRCPATGEKLSLQSASATQAGHVDERIDAWLVSHKSGTRFPVVDGIPDLSYPFELSDMDRRGRAEYDAMASAVYDNMADWLFDAFGEDENSMRSELIDRLEVGATSRVLEVGCGTGRDTLLLRERLSDGTLFSLDLSMMMVRACRDRLEKTNSSSACTTELLCANGSYLPFPDGAFDAVLHIGGINEFAEKDRAFREMARVTRVGGKVVVVDESMAPWLRKTEYARILTNSNPLLVNKPPLALLPENAADVQLSWLLGNAYYAIEFRIAPSPPQVDLDLPHKGRRGGTLRTRWFGRLEGVTPETKALAEQAVGKLNISMHQWLEELVHKQAKHVLDDGNVHSSADPEA